MKNVRTLATSMFALGCLGLFGLVSCADNVIVPPTEAIVAQKNVKSASPNIASINSLAANSKLVTPVDVLMTTPTGAVRITGYTVDAVNKSVTLFFDVTINEKRFGEGASINILRDVTAHNGSFSSLNVFVGDFSNGSYSETSPSGLPPGFYTLRLKVDPSGIGSGSIQVEIP